MITSIPAFEFLSRKIGEYPSDDGKGTVHLKRAGYGFALEIDTGSQRGSMFGVIGVAGSDLVLHSNVDLPNVMVFRWPHAFAEIEGEEVRMEFTEGELKVGVILDFAGETLGFSFVVDGKAGKAIAGRRATKPSPPVP